MASAPRDSTISLEEWRELPITVGVSDTARVLRISKHWVSDHAAELGGVKLGGRWLFSKSRLGELAGIEG